MPWCNTDAMAQHLAAIAGKVAPGRHAVLLLDRAGWHMSAHLVVPEWLCYRTSGSAALCVLSLPFQRDKPLI